MSFTKIKISKNTLLERKFHYAIVDQNCIKEKHEELYNKMKQTSFSFTKKMSANSLKGDIKFYNNIDDCLSECLNDYGIVLIQSIGNFIRINSFFEYLNTYVENNPDFFILSFTLDWESEHGQGWIEIHNQMMVVNIDKWKELGCPKFGGWENSVEPLPNYERSVENFHDKYTPHWIKGIDGETTKLRKYPGWGFLKAALQNKVKIDNFTEEMRNCRLYTYPEHESNNFYDAIISLDSTKINNPNQKKFINSWLKPKPEIWIFNSEDYKFNVPFISIDHYYGPAAGFKYLDVFNSTENPKFIFYDINKDSLDWIKNLKENWDGKNLFQYLKSKPLELKKLYKFINKDIETNINLLMETYRDEDNFLTYWNKFRQSEAEFLHINLLDVDNFLATIEQFKSKRPFFYYSNIFSTDFLSCRYSIEEVTSIYNNFFEKFNKIYPQSFCLGSEIFGEWEYRRNGKKFTLKME